MIRNNDDDHGNSTKELPQRGSVLKNSEQKERTYTFYAVIEYLMLLIGTK